MKPSNSRAFFIRAFLFKCEIMPETEYVLLARIRKPHGVRGEMSVEAFTEEKRLLKLKQAFLRTGNSTQTIQIVSARSTANGVLIRIDGYDDRDTVEALRNAEIVVPLSDRAPLEDGRAYYDDLVGLEVIDNRTEQPLGVVTEILEMPAGDVLAFRTPDGAEQLITMAGTEIKRIDLAMKKIRVELLEEWSERTAGNTTAE